MARPLRLEFESAMYHVTSRGNRREDIFWSDDDRQAWLAVLAHVCERFNWRVYAYCLMSNHYHVVVTTPQGNLSAGMRQLNGVYTQRSNRAHGRSGHVFQGRFKAILVDQENYLLELSRYVVLNPVRAGLVADVSEWPWSSYQATIAPPNVLKPAWLDTDALLSHFLVDGATLSERSRAQAAYAEHVRAGVGLPSIWNDLSAQVFLGGEAFVQRMRAKLDAARSSLPNKQWQEVPGPQRRAAKRSIASYEQEHPDSRNEAIRAAFNSGHYTMQSIAQHFGLHYTSISRIVNL